LNGNNVLYLPESLTKIDDDAFAGCTGLKYLYINKNVCLGSSGTALVFTGDSSLMLITALTFDGNGFTLFYPVANKWWTKTIYIDSAQTTRVKMYFYRDSAGGSLTSGELQNISSGLIAGYWKGSSTSISFY